MSGSIRGRGGLRRLIVGLLALVTLGGLSLTLPAPAAQAAGPVTRSIGPNDDFIYNVARLHPGDTLKLRPGTYSVGWAKFYAGPFPGSHGNFSPGTAAAPITITAEDPNNRPLLRGILAFQGGDYVILDHLRVEATVPNWPALRMTDGVGWSVRNSEFFGAKNTHALANVEIGGGVNPLRPGQPSRFTFLYNAVHDASNTAARAAAHSEHNIYVYFHGSRTSGGLIQRNLIWGHPNGTGIKLGDGGAYNSPGPWGVTVAFNTIASGGRQIMLHGNIRNNKIVGNLFWRATQSFVSDPRTTQVYVHEVTGGGNVLSYNYAYGSSMFMFDVRHPFTPSASIVHNAANRLSAARTTDPRFSLAYLSWGWLTSNPAVAAYGRYGTGKF